MFYFQGSSLGQYGWSELDLLSNYKDPRGFLNTQWITISRSIEALSAEKTIKTPGVWQISIS
jgi:hypothetical protein